MAGRESLAYEESIPRYMYSSSLTWSFDMYTSVVISATLLWVDLWLDCPSLVVSIHCTKFYVRFLDVPIFMFADLCSIIGKT